MKIKPSATSRNFRKISISNKTLYISDEKSPIISTHNIHSKQILTGRSSTMNKILIIVDGISRTTKLQTNIFIIYLILLKKLSFIWRIDALNYNHVSNFSWMLTNIITKLSTSLFKCKSLIIFLTHYIITTTLVLTFVQLDNTNIYTTNIS